MNGMFPSDCRYPDKVCRYISYLPKVWALNTRVPGYAVVSMASPGGSGSVRPPIYGGYPIVGSARMVISLVWVGMAVRWVLPTVDSHTHLLNAVILGCRPGRRCRSVPFALSQSRGFCRVSSKNALLTSRTPATPVLCSWSLLP